MWPSLWKLSGGGSGSERNRIGSWKYTSSFCSKPTAMGCMTATLCIHMPKANTCQRPSGQKLCFPYCWHVIGSCWLSGWGRSSWRGSSEPPRADLCCTHSLTHTEKDWSTGGSGFSHSDEHRALWGGLAHSALLLSTQTQASVQIRCLLQTAKMILCWTWLWKMIKTG